jgi:hypothetical protein
MRSDMRDLNHPKVKPFTREIASRLGLDSTFVNFVFAKERPVCFRYWCEDVKGGWTCFVPETADVAYPLWSTNADQTLILVAGSEVSYAKGWHDNPDIEMISQTSQGLLADLLDKIWQSETSDEEMRVAAQFCGFRYLREYFALVNAPEPNGADWQRKWRQFISGIDAKEHLTNG